MTSESITTESIRRGFAGGVGGSRGMNFHQSEILARSTKAESTAARAAKSPNLLCFIEQFPLAMAAISEIHDYARGPLDKRDYRPSLLRHLFGIGAHRDHAAAVAWNAIAQLEITLREARK